MSASTSCETCSPENTALTSSQTRDNALVEDVMNPETFLPPLLGATSPTVIIEFCDRVSHPSLHSKTSYLNPHLRFRIVSVVSVASTTERLHQFAENAHRVRLRRLHRATWVQTELLLTFPPPVLKSIALIPRNSPDTSGRFRIWLQYATEEDVLSTILIWDRKTRGGFPELKEAVSIVCAGPMESGGDNSQDVRPV